MCFLSARPEKSFQFLSNAALKTMQFSPISPSSRKWWKKVRNMNFHKFQRDIKYKDEDSDGGESE